MFKTLWDKVPVAIFTPHSKVNLDKHLSFKCIFMLKPYFTNQTDKANNLIMGVSMTAYN